MTDLEAERRAERQQRALTTTSGGALIETHYKTRKTKAVAVEEGDLNDMLSLDGIELGLMTFGQFFASGALWLFLDKYADDDFAWTALTGFCAASFIFGLFMVIAALVMRNVKRRKVRRLFNDAI